MSVIKITFFFQIFQSKLFCFCHNYFFVKWKLLHRIQKLNTRAHFKNAFRYRSYNSILIELVNRYINSIVFGIALFVLISHKLRKNTIAKMNFQDKQCEHENNEGIISYIFQLFAKMRYILLTGRRTVVMELLHFEHQMSYFFL